MKNRTLHRFFSGEKKKTWYVGKALIDKKKNAGFETRAL